MALRASHLAGFVGLAALFVPALAQADVQHTVARGHTIEALANRYHVSAKAIMEANHLKDAKHLRVGEVLIIPGVKDTKGDAKGKTGIERAAPSKADERADARANAAEKAGNEARAAAHATDKASASTSNTSKKGEKVAKLGAPSGRETTTFAMKAKTPGVIHVHRLATTESYDIHVGDKRGRISPVAMQTFEKMMRSPNGMAHPIDARLVSLLAVVSNHFGSRKLEVVSGFRPFTPTQFNPHSNHMHGKAVDFRVTGVPNEAVRDFCRTLKNVGCGYYPNSVFVHMDVREQNAFWIDYSKPGEAPRYNAPNPDADEGTSDVQDEPKPSTTETLPSPPPAEAPAVPVMPAAPGATTPTPDTGDN